MRARGLLGTGLIVAGLALCGIVALHYWRGTVAQREGRAELERLRPTAADPIVPTPETAPTQTPAENPSVSQPSVPTPTPEPAYPYGRALARLRIPAAQIDVVVFGGADAAILEKGPGTCRGQHCPACAHGTSRFSFRHLGWLKPGHQIFLETPTGQMSYRIVLREIVKPDAVSVLAPSEKARLTLITCYPFNFIGPAPERLVLIAEPLPPERARHSS
ncbi:MAG TPA: sortase [Thermoanaerobaculia bacterium]|nr:sortase [Thermoanaerobaculia bacterium]